MNIALKYRHLAPVNDMAKVEEAWHHLVTMPPAEQKERSREHPEAGKVLLLPLYDSDTKEHFFLEYVKCADPANEDSVTTLYHNAPEFQTLEALIDTRKELILSVAQKFSALPSVMTVMDAGRNREAWLNELGTAQLLDILAMSTGTDVFSGIRT